MKNHSDFLRGVDLSTYSGEMSREGLVSYLYSRFKFIDEYVPKSRMILDIECGPGIPSLYTIYSGKCKKIVVIDLPEIKEDLLQNVKRLGYKKKVLFIGQNLDEKWRIGDKEVDVVTSFDCLYLAIDQQRHDIDGYQINYMIHKKMGLIIPKTSNETVNRNHAFKEAFRVLKSDGRLIIVKTCGNPDCVFSSLIEFEMVSNLFEPEFSGNFESSFDFCIGKKIV